MFQASTPTGVGIKCQNIFHRNFVKCPHLERSHVWNSTTCGGGRGQFHKKVLLGITLNVQICPQKFIFQPPTYSGRGEVQKNWLLGIAWMSISAQKGHVFNLYPCEDMGHGWMKENFLLLGIAWNTQICTEKMCMETHPLGVEWCGMGVNFPKIILLGNILHVQICTKSHVPWPNL